MRDSPPPPVPKKDLRLHSQNLETRGQQVAYSRSDHANILLAPYTLVPIDACHSECHGMQSTIRWLGVATQFLLDLCQICPVVKQAVHSASFIIIIIIITRRRKPYWVFAGGMESTTGYSPPVWDLLLNCPGIDAQVQRDHGF
jgi:hypothetical protein